MYLSLKKGAIFVADSHFSEVNMEFLSFLEKLKEKEIETSQLFLMGDMFDFISGESRYFVKINQKLIDIINELSQDIEIIYLEGNHDYNLQKLFPNLKVYKREAQPIFAKYEQKTIALAHGDIYTPKAYDIYCKIIRNHALLVFLNLIDINYWLSKKIYNKLTKKSICSKMRDFDSFAKKRLANYNSNIVIEGHFHQGKSYEEKNKFYINIPSLCCDKKYTIFDEKFITTQL